MRIFSWSGLLSAVLVGCAPATNEADRAAFDILVRNGNNGPLGIAVPAGSEDRIFECYLKTLKAKGAPLSTMAATVRAVDEGKDLRALPEKDRQDATLYLLLASSTIVGCQGGLPEGMR